jgi:alpha 1,6-mannosyltransferase
MITYRKALIAALSLLAFVFFLRSSHSASRIPPESESVDYSRVAPSPASRQAESIHQIVLESLKPKPLRERLRYQYPYDLTSKFPAYIWQTWKVSPASGSFDEDLRPLEASWTIQHPGFVHEVIGDDTADQLIRYLYGSIPEVYEAYHSLPIPVLKADFFRYLILLARGGIYTDIDTFALKPASYWLPEEMESSTIGLIVGIEADPDRPDWRDWYSRRIQFCQWTIQAKPGHPILRDIVATITEDTLRMKRAGILSMSRMDKTIVEFTGPAVWTDAIFRYFNSPHYFQFEHGARNVTYEDFTGLVEQTKVGDVAVLPITGFSPGVQQMGAEDIDHPLAFVRHEFVGSWKPESERWIGEEFDDDDD